MSTFNYEMAKLYADHTIKRSRERYALVLNENQVCELGYLIMEGRGILKKICSATRSIYKINFKKKNLVVVFDKVQMLPVTVLPHKNLARYNKENHRNKFLILFENKRRPIQSSL